MGILHKGTSLANVYRSLKEKYGDVYRFWLGLNPFIVISNADYAQYIFSRRDVYDQSHFFKDWLDSLMPNGLILTQELRSDSVRKLHFDMYNQYQRLMQGIIGLIAFDYDLQREERLNKALGVFLAMMNKLLLMSSLPKIFLHTYVKLNTEFQKAMKTIQIYTEAIVLKEQQIQGESKGKSLISSLVSSLQENEVEEQKENETEQQGKQPVT
ncbi:unnamed protein product [Didymodactylos carnosus]|uniref:Cytochrome P450 n=1 Tax=Didymodactylos carnosus TaxID=1234261 RepID=A0A815DC22_9BILA|nr:unnamed protein product [Didymodactylos carnosus]CAF4120835.1 unnamed protein product [Didymodactylos carnosus]